MLDLREHGEVIGIDEYVPAVLERCQQIQGLLEVENDLLGRFASWRFHTGERSDVATRRLPYRWKVRTQGCAGGTGVRRPT